MEKQSKKIFQFRAFVSLLTGFTFVMIVLTGGVLFITPPGRVANWTGWTFGGLTKHQWTALHVWFCLLFTVVSIIHLMLNFRPLVNYLKITASRAYRFRFEWAVALGLCAVIFAGTHYELAPFSSLLDWQESIKFSWEDSTRLAPAPHAELWTLAELAQNTETELETISGNLQARNISADSADVTLNELAEQAGMTPNELYGIALGQTAPAGGHGGDSGGGQGQGFGRLTLQQVADQANIPVDLAIQILEQEKIIGAAAEKTMRQIADENNLHPSQIRQLLLPE